VQTNFQLKQDNQLPNREKNPPLPNTSENKDPGLFLSFQDPQEQKKGLNYLFHLLTTCSLASSHVAPTPFPRICPPIST